jgi:hypothetical protein
LEENGDKEKGNCNDYPPVIGGWIIGGFSFVIAVSVVMVFGSH